MGKEERSGPVSTITSTITIRMERFAFEAEVLRRTSDDLAVSSEAARRDLLMRSCFECTSALHICWSVLKPVTLRAFIPCVPQEDAAGLRFYGTAEPEDDATAELVEAYKVAALRIASVETAEQMAELAAALRNQVFAAVALPECAEEGMRVFSPEVAHGLAHHLAPVFELDGGRYEPALVFEYPASFGPKYPKDPIDDGEA